MKKRSLIALIIPFLSANIFAQCTVANQTITEDFNSTWPACWTAVAYASHTNSKLTIRSYYQSTEAQFVLPKTVNAKGVINFMASNTTNGQQGFGNVTIGAVSDPGNMASFVPITTVNIYPTISGNQIISKAYSADLSSYTGNYQYIAFTMPGNTSYNRVINFDDFDYESACISTTISAVAQDISVQLNNTGTASISTTQVDNGSTSDCPDFTLSLDKTSFDCTNIGANQVVLTATDNQGATSTANATVTILAAIDDETLTQDDQTVCSGGSTTINTNSSISGINYWLRDNSNNAIIDGPVVGTGSSLSFNTNTISQSTDYEVYAETSSPWYGLSFDGVNDKVVLGTDNRGITTQVTISAWIKTNTTGVANWISSKYDGANGYLLYISATGKLNLDGRDGSGGYKQSGASTTSVNDGNWHYVSGTINTASGVWSVFVDGILENSATNAAGGTLANTAYLGAGHHITTYYNGEIDEFSLWSTALDQATIQTYMNNCLSGAENNCVGLFNFNEGSGTTATDLSSSAVNGTLTNMDASDWVSNGFSCGTVCDFTMSQIVTVGMTPANDITTSYIGNVISANQSGATYQWLDCNNANQPIQGEINQGFSPTLDGDYCCEITVGCRVDTSACINVLTTSIDNIENIIMSFSPNPVHDFIMINADGHKIIDVIVYDLTGKRIHVDYSSTEHIDVSVLQPGLYYIAIESKHGIWSKPFVKN